MEHHNQQAGPEVTYESFADWEEKRFGEGKPYHASISVTFDQVSGLDDASLYQLQLSGESGHRKYALRHFLFYRLTEIEGERINNRNFELLRILTEDRTITPTVGWRVFSLTERHFGISSLWSRKTDVDDLNIKRKLPILLERKAMRKAMLDRCGEVHQEIQRNLRILPADQLRNLVAAWAKEVLEEISGKPQLADTVICQILRQLRSLAWKQEPDSCGDYDWFAGVGDADILDYVSDLLTELYGAALNWDGVSELPPRIMTPKNSERTLVAVSMLAPFSRIFLTPAFRNDRSESNIFDPDEYSAYDTTKDYATDEIQALLMAGLVYTDFRSGKQKQYPLQMMPVRLWLMDPEQAWKDIGYEQLPGITLKQLCQKVIRVYKKNPVLGMEDVSVLDELSILLCRLHSIHKQLQEEKAQIHSRLVPLRRRKIRSPQTETEIRDLEAQEQSVSGRITDLNGVIRVLTDVLMLCCAEWIQPVLRNRRLDNETVKNGIRAYDVFLKLLSEKDRRVQRFAEEQHIPVQWQKKMLMFASNSLEYGFSHGKDYDFWRIQAKHNAEQLRRPECALSAETVQKVTKHYLDILLLPLYPDGGDAIYGSEAELATLLFDHLLPAEWLLRDTADEFPEVKQKIQEARASLESCASFHGAVPGREPDLTQWALGQINGTAPEIWLPAQTGNGLRKKYFLGDLDGVAVSVYGDDPVEPEVRLMAHLLTGNDVVMSLPQMVDSRLIRNLAFRKEFQILLRSGRICLSSYGNHFRLAEHCAAQMERNFHWSSLEPDQGTGQPDYFEDPQIRQAAAEYLRSRIGERELPEAVRAQLTEFKAALRCLEENLPFDTRACFHQRKGSPAISYTQELERTFDHLKRQNHSDLNKAYWIHKRIHETLIARPGVTDPGEYFRSDYYGILKLIADPSGLEDLTDEAWKKMVAQCIEAIGTPKPEWLRKTTVVCNNVYLDTTGRRFTSNLSIPNRDEDAHLFHPDARNLEYRDSSALQDAARGLQWGDIVEINSMLQQNPRIRLEEWLRSMDDPRCVLDLVGSCSGERLLAKRVELTSNSGKHLKVELASAGISHSVKMG